MLRWRENWAESKSTNHPLSQSIKAWKKYLSLQLFCKSHFVSMCVHEFLCTCVHVCRLGDSHGCCFSHFHLVWDRVTLSSQEFSCLHLPSLHRATETTDRPLLCLAFLVGSGDLNSGQTLCTAGILPTEISPPGLFWTFLERMHSSEKASFSLHHLLTSAILPLLFF